MGDRGLRLSHALARRLEMAEAHGAAQYAASQAQVLPAAQAAATAIDRGPAQIVYAGPGSPVSRAIGLGLDGPVPPAMLDLVEAFFRRRGEQARIDCCPLADDSLARLLAQRGYVLAGFRQVMAMTLTDWSPGEESNPAVVVTEVGADEQELWVDVVSRGFAATSAGDWDFDRSIARPSVLQAGATCLLAWMDGVAVGGGVVDVHDGVALLRTQSTLPGYRGRGVQTAVVGNSLGLAVAAGCDLGMVHASPGSPSQRNLERAGFRTLYTKPTLAGPANWTGR
jgi:GNAT superfamily N-acetyltransferase